MNAEESTPKSSASASKVSAPAANGGSMSMLANAGQWTISLLVIILVVIIAAVGSLIAGIGPFSRVPTAWSAVFLTDSEVFFGHVKSISTDNIDLVNVYYLQRSQSTSTGTTQTAPTQLSILGLVANQIQCPKDELLINRKNVLNVQELQSSSFVVSRLNTLSKASQSCFQPTAASPTATPAASSPATSAAASPSSSTN